MCECVCVCVLKHTSNKSNDINRKKTNAIYFYRECELTEI